MNRPLNPRADVFIPDGTDPDTALARTSHLAIAAHQDDLEIMAWHGIRQCFHSPELWFSGIVVTDGAGSPRTGDYAGISDREMMHIRREEQHTAARIGRYSAMVQLGYPGSAVKNNHPQLDEDLDTLLALSRPDTVYLHNPADKHDTHVAVLLRSLAALRRLPEEARPRRVFGCEVWRSLDWVNDDRKAVLPHDGMDNVAAALLGVFDSQISGGKRYDLAAAGRRIANATFFRSHDTDAHASLSFALDLTPLVTGPDVTLTEFIDRLIAGFRADVLERLARFGGN